MKNIILENFFTSGWTFNEDKSELKNKFQMINIALVLSSISLLFGITANIVRDLPTLVPFETVLLFANIILLFLLRFNKNYFELVSITVTLQFSFLFLLLVYISKPDELKHIWIFTYPIVLLYFRNDKNAIPWVAIMVIFLIIAPLQSFIHVEYSLFQVTYISFVLITISIIIYFYQKKMDEANILIVEQKNMLKQQLAELTNKDKILTIQSKQAVMGEMISMIAHQWRQPLSTVTLNISNLQVKKLLGQELKEAEVEQTLEDINNTIIYLSETIDDFQTYFHPNKDLSTIEIDELIKKAINFTKPRLKDTKIAIEYKNSNRIIIETYTNEIIQVLLNILNNAIDELITRKIINPKIVIRVKNVFNEIEITILDNAGGISSEHIDAIFEPYFSTKGKNGTGLGLYMSQMIMQKQFQSRIEVVSENNTSCFSLKLPKRLT